MLVKRTPIPVIRYEEATGSHAESLPPGFAEFGKNIAPGSFSKRINELISSQLSDYVILARKSIILDEALPNSVYQLIDHLNQDFPTWGVCGATGTRCDGERSYWYLRRPPNNPEASAFPHPVITLGSEILLLNLKQLRADRVVINDEPESWQEIGPLISILCLERALCVLVDRRLMVVDYGDAPKAIQDGVIGQILSDRFVNHLLKLPCGNTIEASNPSYQKFLALPPINHGRRDLLSCYDASLAKLRKLRPISLSIACRTLFNRPHLLERALLSFAAARTELPQGVAFKIFLVSDTNENKLNSELQIWRERFPALEIYGLLTQPRSRETSRVDNILTPISEINTDFIWFIDDDDFVMPGALASISRLLVPNAPILFIGSSEVLEESWSAEHLRDFHTIGGHSSRHVFDVFNGENFVPICGMILPAWLAKERCRDVQALGEYLEDYFVLMRVLTSPKIEVELIPTPIAGISLRGNENSVREKRRHTWNKSYAQFVGELVRDSESTNPLLWQMTRR